MSAGMHGTEKTRERKARQQERGGERANPCIEKMVSLIFSAKMKRASQWRNGHRFQEI